MTNPCFTNPVQSMFYKSSPCFTNPIHVLQIQSMFYKSNPVHVLQYACNVKQIPILHLSFAQARTFRHLANEHNFLNRSTVLKKHQILSRSLEESFSGNFVKISERLPGIDSDIAFLRVPQVSLQSLHRFLILHDQMHNIN